MIAHVQSPRRSAAARCFSRSPPCSARRHASSPPRRRPRPRPRRPPWPRRSPRARPASSAATGSSRSGSTRSRGGSTPSCRSQPLRALFWTSLASGFGSNPVGLDRGASGADQVVRFERDGDRVLMIFENTGYRTSLDDAAHRRSVEESFPPAPSRRCRVLAEEGGRTARGPHGGGVPRLERRGGRDVAHSTRGRTPSRATGRRSTARTRRATRPTARSTSRSPSSPRAGPAGSSARITPDGRAFTHAAAPLAAAAPRRAIGRASSIRASGFFGITLQGLRPAACSARSSSAGSRGTGSSARTRPTRARRSRNPIVYYIDRGIPEPMRQATLDGVRFWTEAFDRAGLARRLRRRVPARGRGSARRALQRGAVGEPQRARLVGGRLARRSAHGADPEGHGAHGLPPRAHRLQPLRRAHGRRRRRGGHALRPRARAAGERARGRAHARPGAQLHRQHAASARR